MSVLLLLQNIRCLYEVYSANYTKTVNDGSSTKPMSSHTISRPFGLTNPTPFE